MKRTWMMVLLVNLLLSACAPVTGPTPTPSATPMSIAVLAPTSTVTPTATPTPSPTPTDTATPSPTATATPTPIPTLPPEQVGGLTGVPDPRVTNPGLFSLTRPDAPIPQFVNAMRMAGIEVTGEQVLEELTFISAKANGLPLVDKDGNPFIVATYNFDPEPSQQGETFEGPIPFLIATQNARREWKWEKMVLNSLSRVLSVKIGGMVEKYPGSENILKEFDFGLIASTWGANIARNGTNSNLDFSYYEDFQISFGNSFLPRDRLNGGRYYLNSIIFPQYPPPGFEKLNRQEAIDYLKKYVTDVVRHFYERGVRVFAVVNEPYHPTGDGKRDVLLEKIGPEYVEIAFQAAREATPRDDVILILNETSNHDYRQWGGAYTNQTRNLIVRLKEKGLVDWVGVQAHFAYSPEYPYPSTEDLVKIFNNYGVPVLITEFDVNLSAVNRESLFRNRFQAEGYQRLVEACLQAENCIGISFYGAFPDKNSWYERSQGQPNADPTLWNDDLSPKAAYFVVLKTLFAYIFDYR